MALLLKKTISSLALVNTNAAAAAGLLTWTVIDAVRGQVSVSGSCVGSIVGLVAVTPACGFIQPGWALLFGIIPVLIIYFIVLYEHHMKFDDTLDVAVVHGCGGIIGAFMTGLFAELSNNPAGADGAFYGHPIQLWYQIAGILTAIGFASACTAGILLPLKYTIGIRLSAEEELRGLDWIAHGEKWELHEKPHRGTTTTVITTNRNELPPYSNRTSSRSRLNNKRRNIVRWKTDISRSKFNANQENNPTV
ncbi:hypothetical protein I4U23_021744 [Adineta vaga]|nr:hypothetical protein I4U23_021744 [Adineta vaga]